MDPPPPSQSQLVLKSNVFSIADGTPIRVFTQADMYGRARVLRDLRLNGAEISSDANNAQVMLVDPETWQGKQFIRDWGRDSNKCVLNFSWVRKSLEAQRPLLEVDGWGGCLTRDDGAPIVRGGGEDMLPADNAKSPLPTPRVTPEDLARMRSKTRQASVSMTSHADDIFTHAPTPPPTAAANSLSISTDRIPSQPLSTPVISPMSGMNPFMFMQNAAGMNNMQNIPASMMAFTQAVMANMLVNSNVVQNQSQFTNDSFMLALQDTMRNHVTAGWPSVQTQNGTANENQPMSPLKEPPLPYPRIPSGSKTRETSESSSPIVEQSTPCRFSSPSECENSISKGKGSISSSHKRRKVSTSSAKDVKVIATSVKSESPSQKKLFTTPTGREFRFFVQIEIHNRFNLVSSIKKNGGKIVDAPASADYAVLYAGNHRQKVYKSLLEAAISADVPAVQAKFVNDCLSKNKLVDHRPYLHEPESKGKRKRSLSKASIESEDEDEDHKAALMEQKRLAKNARQAERRARLKQEKEQDASKSPSVVAVKPRPKPPSKSTNTSYPRATNGPPTPTPPPESTRELCAQGFKFSPAEDEFALRFAKTLIDRDYSISQSAVINAIHQKLPHHPLRSWRTHFSQIATEWDVWRKRAAIAYRKALSQKDAEATAVVTPALMNIEAEEQHVAGPSHDNTVRIWNMRDDYEQDLEDDINAAVQFFVDGNDRDQTEDESLVWNRLTATTPCKTERNWETFYEKHSEVVVQRYNNAVNQQQQQ